MTSCDKVQSRELGQTVVELREKGNSIFTLSRGQIISERHLMERSMDPADVLNINYSELNPISVQVSMQKRFFFIKHFIGRSARA